MTFYFIGRGTAVIAVGLIPRLAAVYLVVSRNNFTRKEKLFIVLSWIPKATVQVPETQELTMGVFCWSTLEYRTLSILCKSELEIKDKGHH